MKQMILKQTILEAIKNDALLYGKVAYILGLSAMSMPKMLQANDRRLTQASVLRILREHLGIKQDSELLEEKEIPEKEVA